MSEKDRKSIASTVDIIKRKCPTGFKFFGLIISLANGISNIQSMIVGYPKLVAVGINRNDQTIF